MRHWQITRSSVTLGGVATTIWAAALGAASWAQQEVSALRELRREWWQREWPAECLARGDARALRCCGGGRQFQQVVYSVLLSWSRQPRSECRQRLHRAARHSKLFSQCPTQQALPSHTVGSVGELHGMAPCNSAIASPCQFHKPIFILPMATKISTRGAWPIAQLCVSLLGGEMPVGIKPVSVTYF